MSTNTNNSEAEVVIDMADNISLLADHLDGQGGGQFSAISMMTKLMTHMNLFWMLK